MTSIITSMTGLRTRNGSHGAHGVTRPTLAVIVSLLFVLGLPGLHAQSALQFSETSSRHAQTPKTSLLPKTPEEIDNAIARVEARRTDVRAKASGIKPSQVMTVSVATQDELVEREQLFQQWLIALDQNARHLRSLKEIRRLNQERDAWRGFVQPPTAAMAEQLTDLLSGQRLELRTAEMFLAILQGEISRYSVRLNESQKQLRLVQDFSKEPGMQDSRRHWLIQLAQLRNQANEASVETAETGRLVTWQALDGQREYVEFLERKLSTARAQVRITRKDLNAVLAQINSKRTALQNEMNEVIAADDRLRESRETSVSDTNINSGANQNSESQYKAKCKRHE
jgi:hypothetical protein